MPPSKGIFEYTFELLSDVNDPKYGDPVDVPLIIATEENVKEYGRLVRDYDKEEVWIFVEILVNVNQYLDQYLICYITSQSQEFLECHIFST